MAAVQPNDEQNNSIDELANIADESAFYPMRPCFNWRSNTGSGQPWRAWMNGVEGLSILLF